MKKSYTCYTCKHPTSMPPFFTKKGYDEKAVIDVTRLYPSFCANCYMYNDKVPFSISSSVAPEEMIKQARAQEKML